VLLMTCPCSGMCNCVWMACGLFWQPCMQAVHACCSLHVLLIPGALCLWWFACFDGQLRCVSVSVLWLQQGMPRCVGGQAC
jgi:hypothetical protein